MILSAVRVVRLAKPFRRWMPSNALAVSSAGYVRFVALS